MRIVLQLYLFIFFLQPAHSFSQKDSLENLLANSEGHSRMVILNKLTHYYRTEDPTKSRSFGEEYLELSRELGDQLEEIKALNALGITFYQLGYYEITLEYFIQSLQVSELLSNENEIARSLNNLGNLFDEIGDKEKAISYYKRSLKLKEELKDRKGLANTLSNIGYIYNEWDDTDQAYVYFRQALQIDEEEGAVDGIFASLNNLGMCFVKKAQYDSALYYLHKAFSYEDKIESLYDKADFFNSLGKLYGLTGKTRQAIDMYNTSLEMAKSIKARSLVKDSFKGLAEMHSLSNNHKEAFDCFKAYSLINDSLHQETDTRKIANIESDYKVQKKEQELQLIMKEAEIKNLILTKNKHISYFLYAGLFLLMGFVVVIFQKYQFKVKANNLLKIQNRLIETKNSDITDSINYAKGIQEAILPDLKILETVFAEHFVICKPRDIVNGDFYWFADKGDYLILAVVDCTGHGVPGAFMNVMGNSLLNQIIIDQNISNPSQILTILNKRILAMLHQDSYNRINSDGMDIGVVLFHKETRKLVFSGAKHALYVIREGNLEVIKGNKVSLGGNCLQERFFNDYETTMNTGDCFYLFTDGIIDQFGQNDNKKFMSHRLKEILHQANLLPMNIQAQIIEDKMLKWQGSQEQTDDMLMIGIRV